MVSGDSSRGLGVLARFAIVVVCVGWMGLGVASASGPEWAESLDAELADLQRTARFAGFAVAVVDPDGLRYARGFGLADREKAKPFTDETVLNIGSVSKTFIGVALLQAVERGLVDLDTPIDEYLPYPVRHPKFADVPITLRHLATHTSGIRDRGAIYRKAYSKGETPEIGLDEFLQRYLDPNGAAYSAKNFGKTAPGKAYEYSNIAAALAAHVLEEVAGEPFSEWTRQTILEPLGMTDSGWSYATADRTRHAQLYDGNQVVEPYTLVTYPDGGLRTSVRSLARYLIMILNRGTLDDAQILQTASARAMLAPQFEAGKKPAGFEGNLVNSGIFWGVRSSGLIGHTGGDPGIAAVMFFDPESGCGRLFLTNSELTKKSSGDFKAIWDVLEKACNSSEKVRD